VYFLDTAAASNDAYHQTLSGQLYGGDERYRLCQETLLGIGGVAMLAALGVKPDVYHMNEGHAALLTLALATEGKGRLGAALPRPTDAGWSGVKERCVFTTHTPVPAGHDTFPVALSRAVLGDDITNFAESIGACPGGRLNMSEVAIKGSRYVNGVAKRHAEVSRRMFPGVHIDAITNGVHAVSWTADAMQKLFDKHLAGWREDNNYLRFAAELPLDELTAARKVSKATLFEYIAQHTGQKFDPNVFTLGFARRAAEYKRADLLFHNPERLKQIAAKHPLQIVFGGKAHPRDFGGKRVIENVFAGAKALAGANIKIVYLENYDMTLGRLICSGVDLWLNNPVKPLEASGTSGMKAAINGIPSLSTLDGWWVEGNLEGQVGWELPDDADAFGAASDDGKDRQATAARLYDMLERQIMAMYYGDPVAYARIARNCIYLNGPYFNTHRMVLQYFVQAYTPRA
jgi:starch phosphorylase